MDRPDAHRVVDLAAWRREHVAAAESDEHVRLHEAVEHLDTALEERKWLSSPPWLVTELLAIQGCLSMDLVAQAAWRIERLAQKVERSAPARRAPAR